MIVSAARGILATLAAWACTRAGKTGKMSVWMLIEIGLKLVASIAVLDRIPESQVQGVSGGIRRRGIRR